MNKFKKLNIGDALVENLKNRGIVEPTPIQEQCIEPILYGDDIIAEAQTGTGKTLAFLLPIFQKMDPKCKKIQCLIITPTRELAIQITDEASKLNKEQKYNILAAYGGKDISGQLNKLKSNVDLVVATPGRLLDHIERENIDLSELKIMVVDEADQMLLMGFKKEVESIFKMTPLTRQTLCFSATISPSVKKLAYKFTNNPKVIVIEKEEQVLKNIEQFVIETIDAKKQDALCHLMNQQNPFMAIIFCRTKRRVDELEESLYARGYNCHKLHSDIDQAKREKIMRSFKNTEIQYLIATDVAARGLDITGVTHIYNYDIPEDAEGYIHRIGRTGRAGEKGQTYLFVDPKDHTVLDAIEADIEMKIQRIKLDHVQRVVAENQLPAPKYNKRVHVKLKNQDEDKRRR